MNLPPDVDPTTLVEARTLAHHACQWPSMAARANVAAKEDDSHSNLGWSHRHVALISHFLDDAQRFQLGFSFATNALVWLTDDTIGEQFVLASKTARSIKDWVDANLLSARLKSTDHVEMPYTLDGTADYSRLILLNDQMKALGIRYANTQDVLEHLVSEYETISVISPTIRCWPHHFDVAVLFILEAADLKLHVLSVLVCLLVMRATTNPTSTARPGRHQKPRAFPNQQRRFSGIPRVLYR